MPRKNIYIRKEDEHILEKAKEKIGEDKALGALLMEALEEKLENLPEVYDRALRYQLLKQLNVPAFNEIINYKLQNYSETVLNETEKLANMAYIADPDHFRSPISDGRLEDAEYNPDKSSSFSLWRYELIDDIYLWEGIEAVIEYDHGEHYTHPLYHWYNKALSLIEKGEDKLKEKGIEKKVNIRDLREADDKEEKNG